MYFSHEGHHFAVDPRCGVSRHQQSTSATSGAKKLVLRYCP